MIRGVGELVLLVVLGAPVQEAVRIEGVVVRSGTTQPIPSATVSVTPVSAGQTGAADGTRPAVTTLTTGSDGRFVFSGLPRGVYSVRVEAEGYFAASAGGARGSVSRIVDLAGAGVSADPLSLGLTPAAVVAGRVQDETREPLGKVRVELLEHRYADGETRLSVVGEAETDDAGRYRIAGLPPGQYHLRAVPAAAPAPEGRAHQTVWYFGAASPSTATMVRLRGGEDLAAHDFVLPGTDAFTVSGRIVSDVPGLDPSVLPEWVLVPRTPDWRILGQLEVADRAPETDRFEFRGVLPGSYYLYPIVSDRARERGSRPLWYTGRVAVEVVDGDVTELVSQIVPGREVAGVVTGDLVAGRVRLSLIPLDYDVAALVNQASGNLLSPDEEGRFRWENIPPGRYRIIVLLRRPPVDAYVADIRLGARSLYENPVIDVGAGLNEMLEVVIAGDGGVLGGRVEDRAGREVTGPAFVVLVPAGAGRANPMLYRTGEVSGGRFRLTGVAPGSYRLFALAGSPPPGVEPNAEFTARFEPWAVPVLVRMGEPNAEIVVRPAPALE